MKDLMCDVTSCFIKIKLKFSKATSNTSISFGRSFCFQRWTLLVRLEQKLMSAFEAQRDRLNSLD
jgi:hypothetical protein